MPFPYQPASVLFPRVSCRKFCSNIPSRFVVDVPWNNIRSSPPIVADPKYWSTTFSLQTSEAWMIVYSELHCWKDDNILVLIARLFSCRNIQAVWSIMAGRSLSRSATSISSRERGVPSWVAVFCSKFFSSTSSVVAFCVSETAWAWTNFLLFGRNRKTSLCLSFRITCQVFEALGFNFNSNIVLPSLTSVITRSFLSMPRSSVRDARNSFQSNWRGRSGTVNVKVGSDSMNSWVKLGKGISTCLWLDEIDEVPWKLCWLICLTVDSRIRGRMLCFVDGSERSRSWWWRTFSDDAIIMCLPMCWLVLSCSIHLRRTSGTIILDVMDGWRPASKIVAFRSSSRDLKNR